MTCGISTRLISFPHAASLTSGSQRNQDRNSSRRGLHRPQIQHCLGRNFFHSQACLHIQPHAKKQQRLSNTIGTAMLSYSHILVYVEPKATSCNPNATRLPTSRVCYMLAPPPSSGSKLFSLARPPAPSASGSKADMAPLCSRKTPLCQCDAYRNMLPLLSLPVRFNFVTAEMSQLLVLWDAGALLKSASVRASTL